MQTSTFRGNEIYEKGGEWYFSDTDEPTATTWRWRPCGRCGLADTPCGADGCLGHLPGVMNACCGHGERRMAYIQFLNGWCVRGRVAILLGRVLKIVAGRLRGAGTQGK